MQKRIGVLGSTGSIGTQTLAVVAAHPDCFAITALAANSNDMLLEKQIEQFKPSFAVLADKRAADRLRQRYHGKTKILAGEEGLEKVACLPEIDMVLTSMVGFSGLKPTLAAIEAGKDIALANKETLVAAGELVTRLAQEKGVAILPVDSEHSAIYQCLVGENSQNVAKILLTASGGPFRGKSQAELRLVTIADCLHHPNWTMGQKITVDSATLFNKGLEVIEAKWLFGVDYDQIEVVVHPQSIIHSMVEFVDGAVMAQLGVPDMRIPIQYALSYPQRLPAEGARLDLVAARSLIFEAPEHTVFPALQLAYHAGRTGGTLPCVLNAANEIAVYAFLDNKLPFHEIVTVVQETMNNHQLSSCQTLAGLIAADNWAREYAQNIIRQQGK